MCSQLPDTPCPTHTVEPAARARAFRARCAQELYFLWQVIAGQQVTKGYWLVKAKFYKLVQTSHRAYVLLKLCDENNDNKIDEAELTHQLSALIRLAAPTADARAVTRKAAAVCALVFAEADWFASDANHDGYLSGDEIHRFLRSRSDTAELVLKLVHNIGASKE